MSFLTCVSWYHFCQHRKECFVLATVRKSRSNGPSIQHRVKRSRRDVNYGLSRRMSESIEPMEPALKHSINRVRSTSTLTVGRNDTEGILRRESRPGDDAFWVFDVGADSDETIPQQQQYRQNANDIDDGRTRRLLRYLYDQFVGQEFPPSDTYASDSNELLSNSPGNVTAEVEFESIVETNKTLSFDPINSHTINSSATTITTNTTGDITESVVYTTVTEDAMQWNGDGHADTNKNSDSSTTSIGNDGVAKLDNVNEDAMNNVNATIPPQDHLEPQFQPLRLRAILAEDSGNGILLNDTEREILFYKMLSPALLAWSTSLRVDPVVGNLTVDVHQLLDGQTCGPGIDSGLPSIRVPHEHMTEGIPGTDMIVYLSLGFTVPNAEDKEYSSNNETDTTNYTATNWPSSIEDGYDENYEDNYRNSMQSNREQLKGTTFGRVGDRLKLKESGGERRHLTTETSSRTSPDSKLSSTSSPKEYKNFEANETIEDINICTGEYLAAASYCSTDQYDRPTAALLHICIDDSFFDPKHLRRNIMTLIHELGHALGFNALSMAHFRRPDGTPYTPRNEHGEIPDSTVECTGPEDEHQFATLPLPSEEVLKFRNVRGGVRVAEIVTPSVVQVVRNQFDCQLLTGAELESSEGSPLSVKVEGAGCIGDHWERRLFSSDVMNPIVDDIEYSTRISTLTLAYFADSGWYQVDLSNADVASGWGRGAGCTFVNDTCINEYGDVPPQNAPFFCNEVSDDPIPGLSMPQNIHGCTPDLSRKAKCSIGQYDLDLPKAYQYFNSTYGSDVGGSDTLMDFCPVYDGYDNGLCSSSESETVIRANEVERFGLRNSRCLVGNIFPFYRNTALCLPIACVLEDRTLRIKAGEEWSICKFADQTIQSGSVNITCPDPRRVCPTFFCPYDCLGTGGKCDYDSGQCLCQYENSTHPGETVLDICGIVAEVKAYNNKSATSASTTRRPILQKRGTIDSLMPPSDTKISDYYVSDVLHLDDQPHFLDGWGIVILSITAFSLLCFFVAFFLFRTPLKDAVSRTCASLFFWRRKQLDNEDIDGIDGGNIDGRTREKHKMVASVLVDMRIRESDNNRSNFWRRRRGRDRRDINDSLAETDGRMTDSDVASSVPPAMSDSLSEISSRQIEDGMMVELEEDLNVSNDMTVDVTGKDDFLSATEVEPTASLEPRVMRRRRLVPNPFA